jgi:hypothetical protein
MKTQKGNIKTTKQAEKMLETKVIAKSVTPSIVSYETLVEEFTIGLKFKPAFGVQGAGLNPNLKNHLSTLLNLLDKHKSALDDIEDATLNFLVAAIRENPPVYIARTKDIKTDIEYFIAKTFIPFKGGKKKEVKVYLGKASEFNNDTKNNAAKVLGKKLLIKAINEKFDYKLAVKALNQKSDLK